MSKLELLLKRINKAEEPPKHVEPPEPSNKLKILMLRLETRDWIAESELELIELLRDQEYELKFTKHALKCKWCLLELCLDVERYWGSRCGIWYLDMQNDPEYFMEIYPDAPDPRKYKFGSYWTRDEGQAIPFIKDRMQWAQGIIGKQIPIIDSLIDLVQNWDFSDKIRERYMDLVEQIDLWVPVPPSFLVTFIWGEFYFS